MPQRLVQGDAALLAALSIDATAFLIAWHRTQPHATSLRNSSLHQTAASNTPTWPRSQHPAKVNTATWHRSQSSASSCTKRRVPAWLPKARIPGLDCPKCGRPFRRAHNLARHIRDQACAPPPPPPVCTTSSYHCPLRTQGTHQDLSAHKQHTS